MTTYCEYYDKGNCTESVESCTKVLHCPTANPGARSSCFAMWEYNEVLNLSMKLLKGCLIEREECNSRETCTENRISANKDYLFCCCDKDMCNENTSWIPSVTTKAYDLSKSFLTSTESTNITIYEYSDSNLGVVSLTIMMLLIVATTCVVFALWLRQTFPKEYLTVSNVIVRSVETINDSSNIGEQSNLLDSINFGEIINHGTYGKVWKAETTNKTVSVKAIPPSRFLSWKLEQEVYGLDHFSHPNLSHLHGVCSKVDDLFCEFYLITSYCERRSLFDYIQENVLSLTELYKVADTMMMGLSHLHEERPLTAYNEYKPPIAHRDFKSKHVLLKSDLTACITDFGVSLIIDDENNPVNKDSDIYNWVGTRRYLSPELIQGAVSISREGFLRADMYACGLVLWEMVSRCDAHGGPVSEYKMPFEKEIGLNPTLDDILVYIASNKQRPIIEDHWHNNPDLLVFIESMKECWDHDPEARLTSHCVSERIKVWYDEHDDNNSIDNTKTDTSINILESEADLFEIECELHSKKIDT